MWLLDNNGGQHYSSHRCSTTMAGDVTLLCSVTMVGNAALLNSNGGRHFTARQ
jgi:hypothetical protein